MQGKLRVSNCIFSTVYQWWDNNFANTALKYLYPFSQKCQGLYIFLLVRHAAARGSYWAGRLLAPVSNLPTNRLATTKRAPAAPEMGYRSTGPPLNVRQMRKSAHLRFPSNGFWGRKSPFERECARTLVVSAFIEQKGASWLRRQLLKILSLCLKRAENMIRSRLYYSKEYTAVCWSLQIIRFRRIDEKCWKYHFAKLLFSRNKHEIG